MSGAILFTSGISWTAGSAAFDHIITLLSAHFEDELVDEQLKQALEFGHLAIDDLPAELKTPVHNLLASNDLVSAAVSTSPDETLRNDVALKLFRELRDKAQNDSAVPDWVRCDEENVIVKGLSAERIAAETGLRAIPVRRTFPGLVFQLPLEKITVQLNFGQDSAGADRSAIRRFSAGHVAVHSELDHPGAVLDQFAQLLVVALDEAIHDSQDE